MIPIQARPEPGRKKALALAAAVHLALVGALLYGVRWKNSQPEAVQVELWSAPPAPAKALPPPESESRPEPKPEPRPEPKPEPKPAPKPEPKPEVKSPAKPDIALKQEKKPPEPKKPEPKKPEPRPEPEPKKPEPKPEPKKPEPKPEPRPEPKKPEAPRFNFDDELRKEQKQLEAQRNARSQADRENQLRAAADAAGRELSANSQLRGLADYAAKIRAKVRGNIVLPAGLQGNPEAVFRVHQMPTGEVLSVKLVKSSGNPALDTAIERAILKSSPLPKPNDESLFQKDLDIKYRPFEE